MQKVKRNCVCLIITATITFGFSLENTPENTTVAHLYWPSTETNHSYTTESFEVANLTISPSLNSETWQTIILTANTTYAAIYVDCVLRDETKVMEDMVDYFQFESDGSSYYLGRTQVGNHYIVNISTYYFFSILFFKVLLRF